jgi:hypothetical protein
MTDFARMTDVDPFLVAHLYKERALIELGRENLRGALSLFRDALRHAREKPLSDLEIEVLYHKGCLEFRMGYSRWRQTLTEVLELRMDTASPRILALQRSAGVLIARTETK